MVSNMPQPVFIITSNVEINKFHILDSDCDYFVLPTLEHNDLNYKIELSDTLEMIDTAESQSINIKGTGRTVEVSAVYVPDVTVSMALV